MQLAQTASALGLHEYRDQPPSRETFKQFHALVMETFRLHGITPTYFGAEGEGYPDKYTKISGRAYSKLIKSDFSGICELSLAANPSTSDAPAYDSFAAASLGYVDAMQELLLCMVVNEAFIKIRSGEWEALVGAFTRFHRWDCGYGFSGNVADQPELYIMGMDNGRLSKEDQELLNAWYAAPAEVRVSRLRDVYPYNLLNEQQLHQEIRAGARLKDFIEQQPGCTLTRLTDDGLYQWKISDDTTLDQLRKQLRGLPVMV
jgi:hypothetical protein